MNPQSGAALSDPAPTRRRTASSFAHRLAGRDNAIGLLRLVFAGMVVLSHAFPIGGFGEDPLGSVTHHQVELGELGLYGFFALSGFLVTLSARSSDTLSFLWRRVLRLYPAFVVVLVLGAVVVGPLAQLSREGDLTGYWGGPQGPLDYVLADLRLNIDQFGIHDVFLDDPYGAVDGSVVNGSLWTLWYEFRAYLAVGLLAAVGVLSRARWVVPLAAALTFALVPLYDDVTLLRRAVDTFFGTSRGLELVAVFLVGAAIAVHRDALPCRAPVAAVAAAVAVVTAATALFDPLGLVACTYLVLYAAAALPAWTHSVGRGTDLSYGVYLYAWPVEALLTTWGLNRAGYLPFLLVTLVVVAGLAWCSWHLVEKRALRLAPVGPGRGWVWLPVVGRYVAGHRLAAGTAGVLLLALTAHLV